MTSSAEPYPKRNRNRGALHCDPALVLWVLFLGG